MRWAATLTSAVALLAPLAASAAMPALDGVYVEAQTLVRFATPLEPAALEGQSWLSPAGPGVWVLDPVGRRVGFAAIVRQRSPKPARADTAAPPSPALAVVRWRPLPDGLAALGRKRSPRLSVVGIDAATVWLVDHSGQRLWRLGGGQWHGPWAIGEPVGGVAASGDGLLVNTPEHPRFAFARLDARGRVVARFGKRLETVAPLLARSANSWRLAAASGGDIVAAGAYRGLLRRFTASGEPRWERTPELPSLAELEAARLEAEAELQVEPETGCVTCKLYTFWTFIQRLDDGFSARLQDRAVLVELDSEGKPVGTRLVKGWRSRPETGGIALLGPRLLAVERDRVAVYDYRPFLDLRVGHVEDQAGAPVEDASIAFDADGGPSLRLRSGSEGEFVVDLPGAVSGTLRVEADGFLERVVTGSVEELVADAIVLEAGPRLCVRARARSSGEPVARYRLSLAAKRAAPDHVSVRSGPEKEVDDPDGRACLVAPWPGVTLARVEAEGFASAEAAAKPDEETTVELEPEAVLQLEVRDPDGAPVAGARITLTSPSPSERGPWRVYRDNEVATSDGKGRATLRRLHSGARVVEVRHPDYLLWDRTVELDEGENPLVATLSAGATLRVEVEDQSSRPVAEAEVSLRPRGQTLTHASRCTTARDGACELSALPPGRYELEASAEGYSEAWGQVVVDPAAERATHRLTLHRGVRVSGLVLGGEAYPGTRLEVVLTVPGSPALSSPVGPDGSYAVNEAPSGVGEAIVVERGTSSRLLMQEVEIPSRVSTYELDLVLPPPLTLWGEVRVGERPCGACTVTAELLGADVGRPRRSTAAAGGAYELRLPIPGQYLVSVDDRDSGASAAEVVSVEGDLEHDLDLGRTRLDGVVLTAEARAADGAEVSLVDLGSGQVVAEVRADADGAFAFSGQRPGLYRVSARSGGAAATREVELEAATPVELEIVLPPEETLELELVDGDSGLPLGLAEASLWASSGELSRLPQIRTAGGRLAVPTLGVPPWTLVVAAPGYALATVYDLWPSEAPITVALSPHPRSFTVEVAPDAGTPCGFALLRGDGRPIALSIRFPPGPVPQTAGVALYNFVAPGAYLAVVSTCEGAELARAVTLEVGSTPSLRFPEDGAGA